MPHIFQLQQSGWCLPVNWEIDLTNKCNLNCPHCSSAQIRGDETLTLPQLEMIFEKLNFSPCKSITWAGSEPLLSPIWRDAMEIAHDYGYAQGLYSSLPDITQEDINLISDYCRFAVCHNTSAEVVNPHSLCNWKCSWMIDENNCNFKQLEAMIKKTNNELFKSVEFRPIVRVGMDCEWVEHALLDLMLLRRFDYNATASLDKFHALTEPNFGRHYQKCYGIYFQGVVGATGDVYLCCNRRGESIGNILNEELEDIFKRLKPVIDFSKCPPACRQHTNNKILWDCYLGPDPENVEFC
jgi:MoaA/NifB/PqqE/SkfB family radical SAM enzyme